ncbi:MAG TPA: hypothetical protein VLF20_00840, partial [Patescibacteria group bacterium]|nr:hypothetical protein [Patescibacteria group bacterium]
MDTDMKFYAGMYHVYRTAFVRSVRLLIFILLLFVVITSLVNNTAFGLTQFFFNVFLMIEIFFHYKICRVMPSKTVSENTGDIRQSFLLPVLAGFITHHSIKQVVKQCLHDAEIQLFLQKAAIAKQDLNFEALDSTKDDLAQKAFEVARLYRGSYVTRLDVVFAYLLLSESKTKLFFKKDLKIEDLSEIFVWIRSLYAHKERPQKTRVKFEGGGIGEVFVWGWTYETKKYTTNFSESVLRQEPKFFGREAEFRSMLESLIKIQNNNVLLVGEIGSGKENLVRALAYLSFEGKIGAMLDHRRVYQLLVGPLTAGISNRSDLEIRLQNIIAEISHSGDVLLYIPDFQNVVGGTTYNLDISGALLPYLKTGGMPIVATMTTGAYKTYMEKNPLKEVFRVIHLRAPEKRVAIQMILDE